MINQPRPAVIQHIVIVKWKPGTTEEQQERLPDGAVLLPRAGCDC
jgi:hypothetical protein